MYENMKEYKHLKIFQVQKKILRKQILTFFKLCKLQD